MYRSFTRVAAEPTTCVDIIQIRVADDEEVTVGSSGKLQVTMARVGGTRGGGTASTKTEADRLFFIVAMRSSAARSVRTSNDGGTSGL